MTLPVQEPDRVAGRAVTTVLLAALAFGFVCGLVAWAVWWRLAPGASALPPQAPVTIDGIEQTLFDASQPGLALRERQKVELGSWSWADRDHRLVRLPIDVAMDLTARGNRP